MGAQFLNDFQCGLESNGYCRVLIGTTYNNYFFGRICHLYYPHRSRSCSIQHINLLFGIQSVESNIALWQSEGCLEVLHTPSNSSMQTCMSILFLLIQTYHKPQYLDTLEVHAPKKKMYFLILRKLDNMVLYTCDDCYASPTIV